MSPRLGTALRCLGFHGHLENVEDGGAETSAEPGTLRPFRKFLFSSRCLAVRPSFRRRPAPLCLAPF